MLITIHTPDGPQTLDTDTLTEEERVAVEVNLAHHLNDKHTKAVTAWRNWDRLSTAQKDTILKNLLWYALVQEERLAQDEV